MKTLPINFRRDGFDFQVLQREGKIALLSKSKPHYSRPSYEVVKIQSSPGHSFPDGRTVEAAECLPPSSTWGKLGWTYQDLASAQARFDSLVARLPVER